MLDLDVIAGKLGEESRWALLTVCGSDRGHYQLASSPGHGDVEQAALVGDNLAVAATAATSLPGVVSPRLTTSDDLDKLVHAKQGAALEYIRPCPFLHASDDHQIPFESLGPVRRQHGDGLAARRALGQRVAPVILLASQAVQERPRRSVRQPRDEPLRASRSATTASRSASASAPR